MQVLQTAAVTTKIIGLFQYARIRDRGRCNLSHASTENIAPVTSHLASDAAGSLIPAIKIFGLFSTRIDPRLSVT